MIVVYGLKNCDSCRKAVKLLEASGADFRFHDLRADGLPEDRLAHWLATAGWEILLNRRSTTWRELPEAQKGVTDADGVAALLRRHPTLVKRPVVEAGDSLVVGFGPKEQAAVRALV